MMSQTFLISLCFISAHLLLEQVVEILDLRQAGRLLTPSCRQRMTQFISSAEFRAVPSYGTAYFLRLVQKYTSAILWIGGYDPSEMSDVCTCKCTDGGGDSDMQQKEILEK